MSLPSFPSSPHSPSSSPVLVELPSTGAGNSLPVWLLALCGAFTAVATGVSIMSITLQLKNYRRPSLQRAVVRIMLMVPLYAISSFIALYSLEAAFFIDAVRDLYEAFVIYTFLQLLITYLGGERSLLIILYGRPPIPHPFPVGIFLAPMDVSDPWVLLNLKRGVLQYVQVKPLLVLATVILKATGTYQEGNFSSTSGYTYISIVYNLSICLSLYCLAMFWVAVSKDLKPFRPVPKFLCVKGILFFSFWQSIGISLLVAWKAIKKVGPYTDPEHMSLALVDSLICFEMPIFAIAHQYAFQASDYIDPDLVYCARLPFIYAFRDAFGFKDVWEDTKDTIRGRGVSYQAYEPSEGGLHYGLGRQRRIRAGLRYAKGGTAKYWVPIPGDEARNRGDHGVLNIVKQRVDQRIAVREGYAPLLPEQAAKVVHDDPNESEEPGGTAGLFESESEESDAPSLGFGEVDDDEEGMYERARRIGYAGFPNVDVSKEERRRRKWEEEEGILKGRRKGRKGSEGDGKKGKGKGKEGKDSKRPGGFYGALADRSPVSSSFSQAVRSNGHGSSRKASASAPSADESAEWLYDGDAERPDTWRAGANGDAGAQLRWTKKQLHRAANGRKEPTGKSAGKKRDKGKGEGGEQPETSPFAIGESEDPEEADPVLAASNDKPLPSDAVDLVTEDPRAAEEARMRELRRGEPQTKAPTHVYRHNSNVDADLAGTTEEVYSPGAAEDRRVSESVDHNEATGMEAVERVEEVGRMMAGNGSRAASYTRGQGGWNEDDNPWA